MSKMLVHVAVLAFSVVFSMPVSATIFNLQAVIDGAQANAGAGTGSPAAGSASMTFDDVSKLFSWNISWTGLTAPITVAHFHGPALPNQNAGVQVNFGAIGGLASPSIGEATISSVQGIDLLNELWYINIHTQAFPGGEIRGQASVSSQVPEPNILSLALAGLAGIGYGRHRRKVFVS